MWYYIVINKKKIRKSGFKTSSFLDKNDKRTKLNFVLFLYKKIGTSHEIPKNIL